MLSTLASFVAEAEHHVELPIPPFMYGAFSLLIFAVMLGALFAFRRAASKIPTAENTVEHGAPHAYEGRPFDEDDDTGGHH